MGRISLILLTILLPLSSVVHAAPFGTSFTYQGRLQQSAAPANGDFDFYFVLYDASDFGSQKSPVVYFDDVTVTSGVFQVNLDFGESVYDGDAMWLEIGVRAGNSVDPHTRLSPRQAVTATPFSNISNSTKRVLGQRMEWGTIGNCTAGSAAASGGKSFAQAFTTPPLVYLTPDESADQTGCNTVWLRSRTTSGFTWRSSGDNGVNACDCIHWLAIGL